MAKRLTGRSPRAGDDDVVSVQAEIRDGIDLERQKRHAREYRQSVESEEALTKLSKFTYEPVDYVPALERKQWLEPAVPDFSYLLTEARLKVSEKYFIPIVLQLILGLFFVILTLYFQDSTAALFGIAGLAACAFALHRELQVRRREIEKALNATREAIELRVRELRESIDAARKNFEDAENTRIERIERLLAGDPSAVFVRLEEVLQGIRLPFYMRCSLDYYDNEPLITLYLPGHNIIPKTIVSLTPAGAIDYEEKAPLDVNRQYSEVLAGTAVTAALLVLAYIPTLDVVYVRGLLDRADDPECLFSFAAARENAEAIAAAASALDALQSLGAAFEIGPNATLVPVAPAALVLPPWLAEAPRHAVRNTTLALHQKVV